MWHAEHSSSIAARAGAWSIVSRRKLACQYGSREEFAIRLARQSSPIEYSSPSELTMPL